MRSMGRLLAGCAVLALTGCGLTTGTQVASSKIPVVAAENFWGSIAAQVGGDKVVVTSIIANPATDPHDYEPTANDARLIATARYVIVNGAGYDPWASKLAAANPVPERTVLDIGILNGVHDGANPHMWYAPDFVTSVIDKITSDLTRLYPADAAYFDQQRVAFKTIGLKDYHATIAAIKEKHSGAPVGATESIFAYMAPAAGLNLITPPEYMKAISEGTDPSVSDKATVDQQVASKQIKALVFNSQNSTPDVQNLVGKARTNGIPVVRMTETLSPAGTSFQDWQTAQLKALLAALGG